LSSGSYRLRSSIRSLADARRGKFSVVLVAAFDRIARSTKDFLAIVDELNELGIEFISAREAIDTEGAMGRVFLTLVGSIAELERSLIVERIKAGMRRAKLESHRLGRAPLDIDHDSLVRNRLSGMSLTNVAEKYRVSRVRDSQQRLVEAA
jgi:DNA invertase Pin-like site-specific DNA recombinase